MGKYLNSRSNYFFRCAVCDAEVKRGARACPECGADERTGLYGDEDGSAHLPDDPEDFDYDSFVKQEFGGSPRPAGLHWLWWITGILLLACLAFAAVRGWL